MLNPQLLTDVFDKAQDAAGSAQQELDKYLDSITAKMQKFTNEVHSFWTGLIDSDAVKFFVDLGSQLLKVVNTVGQFQTAITVLGGVLATKGLSVFSTQIVNGRKQLQLFGKDFKSIGSTMKSVLGGLGQYLIDRRNGNAGGLLSYFNFSSGLNSKITDSLKNEYAAFEQVLKENVGKSANEVAESLGGVDNRIVDYVNNTDAAQRSSTGFVASLGNISLKSKLAQVGLGLLSTGLNALIAVGIQFVAQKIWQAFDNYTNRIEKTQQVVKDLESEFESAQSNISAHQKTIEDVSEKYKKLSKGVDKYGNNISLTTEEFNEYHSITKQIYDMYPQLIKGFDAQGQAILDVKGNVDALNQALDKEKILAYNKILEGSDDVLKNYHNARNDNNSANSYAEEFYNQILDIYASTETLDDLSTKLNEHYNTFIHEIPNGFGVYTELFDELTSLQFGNVFDTTSQKEYNDTARGSVIDMLKTQIVKYQSQTDSALQSVVNDVLFPSFWKYMLNNQEGAIYNSEDLQKFITAFITNIDVKTVDEFTSGKYASGWMEAFLGKIETAMSDPSASDGISSALQTLFGDGFLDAAGNLKGTTTSKEYASALNKAISDLIKQLNLDDTDQVWTNVFRQALNIDQIEDDADRYDEIFKRIVGHFVAIRLDDKVIKEAFDKAGINTTEEIVEFYNVFIEANKKGIKGWDNYMKEWERHINSYAEEETPLLPFDQLFSADSTDKDKISSFKTDIKQIGEAIANFNSLQSDDKLDIYEQYSSRFPEIVNGGKLTISMLQQLAQEEWKQVDATLAAYEGTDEYRAALLALMNQAINTAGGFKQSLQTIAGVPLFDPKNEKEVLQFEQALKKSVPEYNKLLNYTRFFTDEQKEFWTANTSGAKTADEAIKKYEEALGNLKFDSLTDILADSTFQSVRENAEKLNEVFANGIVDPDEMQTLRESFSLTDEEILNGQAKELRDWFNGLVQLYAEKGGEAGKAWFGGWLTEQKNYTFDQIITSMFKDMQGVRSMSYMTDIANQINGLSNAEKDLFTKNYVEGDKFSDVMEKIENSFQNLSTMSLPELLDNELFSSLCEEAEDLSSILQNGVTGEESQTLLEKWGLSPENVETVYKNIVNRMGNIADSAGVTAQKWFSGFLRTIYDQKRAISFSDIIDFEFSYEKDGKQISTTLGQYVDEIKSQADVLSTVISDITSKTTSGNHKMWTDILGDQETLRALENIIPGVSVEIRRASNDASASAGLINKLKDAMSALYGEYQTNASALLHQENLTKEAKAALESYNKIILEATKYESDMKNGLHDMADSLDKIYFDGAGESARSFGQALDDVKSEIDTLSDAYSKLMDLNLREDSVEFTSLVQELIEVFPELEGHTGSIYELKAAIAELMSIKSDSVILRLQELSETEGATSSLKNNIDALINSFYQLGTQSFQMDHTINVLKNTRSELNQLASFMNKVNQTGLHLDIDATDDVYNFYPELLEKAEIYGDGTVKLNKEVYERFMDSKEAEIKGQIDAKVAELRTEHEYVQAQIAYYKQRVKVAEAALAAENVAEAEAAIEKLQTADDVLNKELDNTEDRAQAYKTACEFISDVDKDTGEYQMGVSDTVKEHQMDNNSDEIEDEAATAEVNMDTKEAEANFAMDASDAVKEQDEDNNVEKIKDTGEASQTLMDIAETTGEMEMDTSDTVLERNEDNAIDTVEAVDSASEAIVDDATDVDGDLADVDDNITDNAVNTSGNIMSAGASATESIQQDALYADDKIADVAQESQDNVENAAGTAAKNVGTATDSMQTDAINTGNKFNKAAQAFANIGKTGDVVQMGDVVISRKQSGMSPAEIKKEAKRQIELQKQEIKAQADRELKSLQQDINVSKSNKIGANLTNTYSRALDLSNEILDNRNKKLNNEYGKQSEIKSISDKAKKKTIEHMDNGITRVLDVEGEVLDDTNRAAMEESKRDSKEVIEDRKAKIKKLREKLSKKVDEIFDNDITRVLDLDGKVTDNTDRSKQKRDLEQRTAEAKAKLNEILENDKTLLDQLIASDEDILDQIALLMANGGVLNRKDLADALNREGNSGDNNGDSGNNGRDGSPDGDGFKDANEEADKFSEVLDWIEVKIQRIERVINKLDQVGGNTFENFQTRNKAIAMGIDQVAKEMEIQEAAYKRYMAEAEQVDLPEYYKQLVRNGAIDIETITDENLKNQIDLYTQWFEKAQNSLDQLYTLAQKTSALYKQTFDNIRDQADQIVSIIESSIGMINNAISRIETQGYMVSEEFYKEMISNAERQMSERIGERDQLIAQFQKALNDGAVEIYSKEYYDWRKTIDDVTLSIDQLTTSIVEYNDKIRQTRWDNFDLQMSRIGDMATEAQFMIDLMQNETLYNNEGLITNRGISTKGMHGLLYNIYMSEADKFREESLRINEELANDPNNLKLYDRRQQLLEQQREMIKSAEQEKSQLKSLVSEGMKNAPLISNN